MVESKSLDIEIANEFKRGVSMLDLALRYDVSYVEIQNAIRRVMIKEGEYA
jgi:Mor family transcriptional regulator